MKLIKDLLRLLGQIHQMTALDGFHYNNRLAVLYAHIVARAALNSGIVIIKIIELKLNHLYFWMFAQNPVQHLCTVMKRDAEMTDLALLFKRISRLIGVAALKLFIHNRVLRVHEVEVKIIHTACFKLTVKQWYDVILTLKIRSGELVGQRVFAARVFACKTLTDGCFALALNVSVCSIKIGQSRIKEHLYHLGKLFGVDFVFIHGKTHTTEPEIIRYFRKKLSVHVMISLIL